MTKEEAIEKLQDILDEATAYEHAVCYVTNVDKEPLTMAIDALKTEAIPVEWIKKRIEMLNEYTSEYGGIAEYDGVVTATIHEASGLVRAIYDWREEQRKEE